MAVEEVDEDGKFVRLRNKSSEVGAGGGRGGGAGRARSASDLGSGSNSLPICEMRANGSPEL